MRFVVVYARFIHTTLCGSVGKLDVVYNLKDFYLNFMLVIKWVYNLNILFSELLKRGQLHVFCYLK